MPPPRSLLIAAIGLGLVGPLPARAEDLTIVFKVTGQDGESTAAHYFSNTRVRLDRGDDVVLVDLKAGRIVILSMKKGEYSETTFEEIEWAMTSMSAHMEKAMAGIPEGLRIKMMGDAAKDVVVTKGDSRTIASVACQDYLIRLGEKTRMMTCVTTALSPPIDPRNIRNLALLSAPIGPSKSGVTKLVEKMREIPGISLASSTSLSVLGRWIGTSSEATEIRKGPIDPGMFNPPDGLKRVDSPFAKMAR